MKDLSSVKLICSDVDGTLLPWNGKDLSYTAAVIDGLLESGREFAVCTGRGIRNIPPALLGISHLRYAITANGALVIDRKENRILRERTFTAAKIREIAGFLRTLSYPVVLFCYQNGQHYVDTKYPLDYKPTRQSMIDWIKGACFRDFGELMQSPDNFDKLGVICADPEKKQRIREALALQPFASDIFVCTSADWNLEINAAGGTKGEAAVWLAEHLGISPENMLACGDNFNDLSMLQMAGISVAPVNAAEEVKAAADFVVPDCAEDGVEHFLEALPPLKV